MLGLCKRSREENKDVVSFECERDLLKEIKKWLKNYYMNVNDFGKILFKLGFDCNRVVYLKKDIDSCGLVFYYNIEHEFLNENKIELSNNRIIRYGDGFIEVYNFIYYDLDEFYLERDTTYVKKYLDGVICECEIFPYKLNIRIKNSYSELNFLCNGRYRGNIKNIDMLIDYLVSLGKISSLEDVYKNIISMSLGDENKYSDINLSIKDNNDEGNIKYYKADIFDHVPCSKFEINSKGKNIKYYRYFYEDMIRIVVNNGEYSLLLLFCLKDIKVLFKRFVKLDNELDLRKYLINLDFSLSLSDIYKDVCLILDMSLCNKVELEYRFNNECIDKLNIVDDTAKNRKYIKEC